MLDGAINIYIFVLTHIFSSCVRLLGRVRIQAVQREVEIQAEGRTLKRIRCVWEKLKFTLACAGAFSEEDERRHNMMNFNWKLV